MTQNYAEENQEFIKSLSERIEQFMKDGKWYTIAEVSDGVEHIFNQSSVSAGIRGLRKRGYNVLQQINEDNPALGKYQYRIVKKDKSYRGMFRWLPDTPEMRELEAYHKRQDENEKNFGFRL